MAAETPYKIITKGAEPLYRWHDFRCDACNQEHPGILHRRDELPPCPSCGAPLRVVPSASAYHEDVMDLVSRECNVAPDPYFKYLPKYPDSNRYHTGD